MRSRLIIIIAIVTAAGLVSFYIFNKHFKIVDLSTLNVTTGENLEKSKVKIKRGFYTINRKNDEELFADNNSDWIIYEGIQNGMLKTDYGENDFLITYDNKYYFQFRHFIFNGNNQHEYNLDLTKQNDTLYIQADIVGEDKMQFKKTMNLIRDAKYLRCNVPADSSKVIYNMIELK